jgi:hypothetical protein
MDPTQTSNAFFGDRAVAAVGRRGHPLLAVLLAAASVALIMIPATRAGAGTARARPAGHGELVALDWVTAPFQPPAMPSSSWVAVSATPMPDAGMNGAGAPNGARGNGTAISPQWRVGQVNSVALRCWVGFVDVWSGVHR